MRVHNRLSLERRTKTEVLESRVLLDSVDENFEVQISFDSKLEEALSEDLKQKFIDGINAAEQFWEDALDGQKKNKQPKTKTLKVKVVKQGKVEKLKRKENPDYSFDANPVWGLFYIPESQIYMVGSNFLAGGVFEKLVASWQAAGLEVEDDPFEHIKRTVAHEMGHALSLTEHTNDKEGTLMGKHDSSPADDYKLLGWQKRGLEKKGWTVNV